MTPIPRPDDSCDEQAGAVLAPLPGEAGIPPVGERTRTPWSRKGLLAAALLIGTVVTVAVVYVHRFASGTFKPAQKTTPRTGDLPAAASRTPRPLDLGVEPSPRAGVPQQPAPAGTRVPALVPTPEELTEPIGVRPHGRSNGQDGTGESMRPEDAPVLLVSTRPERRAAAPDGAGPASAHDATGEGADASLRATQRNLEAYQQHLQGLLQTLNQTAQPATGVAGATPDGASPTGVPTLGGPLLSSVGGPPPAGLADAASALGTLATGNPLRPAARSIAASRFAQRSLILPKGTAFTCALKTRVVSAAAGAVACQVQRNVYGDDGRVLLIERGSHLDGDYRVASLRPGAVRIPVVWTRLRTPHGVVVDLDAPATGPLGDAGMPGHVDNRWGERLGAAMLLSLIDDAVKLVIQQQAAADDADTIVLPGSAANTSKLAEKVLDSSINIPPLIFQNQGGLVGIVVARDVDFSSVYELAPVPR